MKPFLLHFASQETDTFTLPPLFFDEQISANIIAEGMQPLALSHYLLATQTKTKARRESDDQD
jgi:hypothetical protein